MAAHSQGKAKPCIGAIGLPCPHGATVVTRYSYRCPSCASRHKFMTMDNTEQLERARHGSRNHVKHRERMAREAS